ncbi:hypothetical protein CIPAW_05G171800 [Carya illinoinensis]|uniref:Uncharacterized protein n=1 Tax=Carya illinoinensis TaxID=32201 RepID=A0A8T1QJ90_CARIL|nr:hypothetical protein CIPAW_05G171800 [Carya illinoinensis]
MYRGLRRIIKIGNGTPTWGRLDSEKMREGNREKISGAWLCGYGEEEAFLSGFLYFSLASNTHAYAYRNYKLLIFNPFFFHISFHLIFDKI